MKNPHDYANESVRAQIFRTSSGVYYAYDPFSNCLLTINSKLCYGESEQEIKDNILEYLENHSITKKGSFRSIAWVKDFSEEIGNSLNSLVLQITRKCNLACSYCLYSGNYVNMLPHADYDMTEKTMKQGIDFFVNHCSTSGILCVSFYGGEALLRFDLIKEGIAYARKIFGERKVQFRISSNGTTLNNTVVKWLSENPYVTVSVTVNGSFHDQYRKTASGEGSLDTILSSFEYIKTNYPYVWNNQIELISNLVSERQIGELRDFYTKHINKPPMIITSIRRAMCNHKIEDILHDTHFDDASYDYAEECSLAEDFLLNNYFKRRLNYIHNRYIYLDDSYIGDIGCCLPLEFRIFLRFDGSFNTCERTSDYLCLGNLEEGYDKKKIRELYEKLPHLLEKQCLNCWAQRLCNVCFESLIDEKGELLEAIPSDWCAEVRDTIKRDLILYCELMEHDRIDSLFCT